MQRLSDFNKIKQLLKHQSNEQLIEMRGYLHLNRLYIDYKM